MMVDMSADLISWPQEPGSSLKNGSMSNSTEVVIPDLETYLSESITHVFDAQGEVAKTLD